MAADQTRKKNRKKHLRLLKTHSWFSIPIFLLASILCTAIFLILSCIIVQLSLETRLNSAANQTAVLADLYATGGEDVLTMFDKQDISYMLLGEDGSVLHRNGKNTCGGTKGYYERAVVFGSGTFTLGSSEYYLYTDETMPFMKQNSNNTVSFDYWEILRLVSSGEALDYDYKQRTQEAVQRVQEHNQRFSEMDEDEWEDYLQELHEDEAADDADEISMSDDAKLYTLPLWIAADIGDGTERMVVRTELFFLKADIVLLAILIGVMMTVYVIVMVFMLFGLIGGLINQARLSRFYFTDMITKGRNRIWYLFRGEQLLQSGYAGKNRYAAVDLSLVKYQSFCVCHSLTEGERLLGRIHGMLQVQMHKRELCAHNADGSFALLVHYEDEEALRARLEGIFAALQKADDCGHSLAFHAGVAPVCGTGIRPSRKDADIEQDFSNACNARASLDSSEDSGIAFFDQKLVDEQRWVDTVTECQRRALDAEEFIVYYQPKYDPQTNTLRGAEALIRWQSPSFGFVSPGRFIPIFEKNGFITEIDHYMVSHVARDQRRWLDQGFGCVPVSVNVSRAHFIEDDLAEQIRDAVDAEGTPHALIEIELTESAFFDDKKAMIHTITKLKEYGFAVSMDDFGSGYSSLNSLKDMPLDVLKLDAEFFRGEEAGTDRGEIVVSEAIRLAKSLHMRTVAEGVEIKEQVEFLASQGCDMIQGYYYAKPMPGTDFEQRMQASAKEGQTCQKSANDSAEILPQATTGAMPV